VELCRLPLRGAGGEPIDFLQTINSHGVARLAPALADETAGTYRRSLRLGERVLPITMRAKSGEIVVESAGRVGKRDAELIGAMISRMFRLDDDLSPFYARIAGDERLKWAAAGGGRLLASPTVFEDVVKTICTTNCVWGATVRMTDALVQLGGGAFPEPSLLAKTPDAWYRDVAKMGYRGPYVKVIAADVASGKLDLETLLSGRGLTDEEVDERLRKLPGVGPYAAAHIAQLLGRHKRLILDSWTRPAYLRLTGKKTAKDRTIERAFAAYGDYAGLAFWLVLTHEWHEEL
jgi:3-methyladenine DNA glycosylase/8-oxoguanine DNA glycosylase